ncbi:MAG: DUF3422 family protein [Oceanicaulis sp.]
MKDGVNGGEPAELAIYQDWSGSEFTDRERLAREVDARQPFPLRRHVRVSHMVRFHPSAADVLRRRLFESAAADLETDDWWDAQTGARRRRMAVEQAIGRLADCARGVNHRGQARLLLDTMNTLRTGQLFDYPAQAAREFGKLRRLFKKGQPLDATDKDRAHVLPFHPGGQWQRCWLNFWRRRDGVDPDTALRLFWEGYRGNHNFTIFEDFEAGEDDKRHSPFLTDNQVDFGDTALDGFRADMAALAPDAGFQWVGDMVTTTHVWVVPAAQAVFGVTGDKNRTYRVMGMLRRHFLREPLEEQPEHLEELRSVLEEIAGHYFSAEDPTRGDNIDLRCAITRLADGRAFMFCDRVHSSDGASSAPVRRVIIFDLAMNQDERGRVVKNLCDLFTYHTLAQRDYPSVIELRDVLSAIQEELGAISAEFGQASEDMLATERGLPDQALGESLDKALNRLHRLMAVLGAADLFVMDGVHSAAKTGRSFLRLQNDRIAAMQPRAFSSFRGLDAIVGPFASVIGVLEEVSEQFGHCENRLAELTSLISATLERQHAKQIEDLTEHNTEVGRKAVTSSAIGAVAAAAAVAVAALQILSSETTMGWIQTQFDTRPLVSSGVVFGAVFVVAIWLRTLFHAPERRAGRRVHKKKRPPDRSGGRS